MPPQLFTARDHWRAIILYGRNTATYKLALGKCLAEFVAAGKDSVTINELAGAFFDLYVDRLRREMPQQSNPGRLTALERIVRRHQLGTNTRAQAIDEVADEGFRYVLDAFHTVIGMEVLPFYTRTRGRLILTDTAFEALDPTHQSGLLTELDSRWSLLEAAFQLRRTSLALVNDTRDFYLQQGYARTNVTGMVPVLNAY